MNQTVKALQVQQARLEELLLHGISEQLTRSWGAIKADDTDDDFGRGYNQGYGDALERLWEIVEEHINVNEYRLHH